MNGNISSNVNPLGVAPPMNLRLLIVAAVVLTGAFAMPLLDWARYGIQTELQSYVLLVPFISAYLVRVAGKQQPSPVPHSSIAGAVFAALCGGAAVVAWFVAVKSGRVPPAEALSLIMIGYLALLLAAALAIVGWDVLRKHLFAVCFLAFMVPLPTEVLNFISVALQRASAEAAEVMLGLTGMPLFRDGMSFKFPGLSVTVAEECSGIRSTLVLFLTSLLAGHLFLRTGWKKILLAAVIFPLGVLRNAFRITTISWLTVNVDPRVIDSPLHHRGGPLFFALSLIPLFGLLWILRRSDRLPQSTKN